MLTFEGSSESRLCPVCGSGAQETHLSGLTDLRGPVDGEYALLTCGGCETVRLSPPPNEERLVLAYTDGYFSYKDPSVAKTSHRRKAVEGLIDSLNRFTGYPTVWVPPDDAKSLLDIGCGTGDYLKAVRRPGITLVGIEPHAYAASLAETAGARVIRAPFEEALSGMNDSFDAIVLNHVLEHVRDPLRLLIACRERLRPTGRLQVSVPSISALGVKLFGTRWLPLDAPRHLYHWSSPSLTRLLERAGFTVLDVTFQFNPFTYAQSAAAGRWGPRMVSMAGFPALAVAAMALALAACTPWAVVWPRSLGPYLRVVATPRPPSPS